LRLAKKILAWGVKPIFVFDGKRFPLKQITYDKRKKSMLKSESEHEADDEICSNSGSKNNSTNEIESNEEDSCSIRLDSESNDDSFRSGSEEDRDEPENRNQAYSNKALNKKIVNVSIIFAKN
jgi:hypothetical protein